MTTTAMMIAAVNLYHKKEKESVSIICDAVLRGKIKPENNHSKIWFWSLNRWGREFSFLEHDIRRGLV